MKTLIVLIFLCLLTNWIMDEVQYQVKTFKTMAVYEQWEWASGFDYNPSDCVEDL